MTRPTPLYQLLELKLKRPLAEVVAELRATQTWDEMARTITDMTGVEVTGQSLRNWFAHRVSIEVKIS